MTIRDLGLRANEEAQRLCEVLLPNGKRIGRQWVVGDVAGNPGDSMAVELEGEKRGQWYDHAAGAGGDMLQLVQLNRNLHGIVAAADETRKLLGIEPWKPNRDRSAAPHVNGYDPCSKAWKLKHNDQFVRPTRAWAYTTAEGEVVAYVCRIDWVTDGKPHKDVIPQRKDEKGEWRWLGYKGETKRPLYGLHRIAKQNDGRPLLIVEGEKTADAATKLFPKACATTWMGGCKNVSKADWSPIAAWKGPIVMWPDNDDEGQTAATYLIGRFGKKVRKVILPDTLPPKWDLADDVPDGVSIHGLFDAAMSPDPAPDTSPAIDPSRRPFVCLGCDEAGYYLLSRTEGFLLHYTPSMFTELGCWRIAPDEFWESLGYYRDKSNKVDYAKVAKFLMSECQKKGAFEASMVRGRGVWMDNGQVVIHLGDRLIVDGIETSIVDHKSDYLYPKRQAIRGVNFKKKLTAAQSGALIELLEKCTWSNPRSAYLMSGFMWCALMCGVLQWRPHFFLQGPSSSGKTWLIGNILYPCLKEFSRIFMAIASSEAGVRQSMAIDALLCILDEFDADHGYTSERLEATMGLARQSSSDTGGAGVKGTQDGTARSYALKSCFCFVGTAPAITMKSDASRITAVELRKATSEDNAFNFAEIQALAATTTGNLSWVEGYVSRALSLVKPTLEAVEVFRRVASRILHDTRAGDQNGTLIAGAWMTFNDRPPTDREAEDFMGTMQWDDIIPTETETDHSKCLRAFLAHRVDFEDNGHTTRQTIGRLIERSFDQNITEESASIARRALEQHGVRIEFDRIFVAKSHRGVENVFKFTTYAAKWETHFLRLAGSEPGELRISGVRFKGVWIEYKALMES